MEIDKNSEGYKELNEIATQIAKSFNELTQNTETAAQLISDFFNTLKETTEQKENEK